MRNLLSKILSIFVGATALATLGVTLWYVFGDLPNPLPTAILAGFGEVAFIIRWPAGLAVYAMTGALLMLAFQVSARVVLVGWSRFIAEEKERSAKEKKAAIRQAGTLVAVSVENGGFLDSATSMIETTDGFYRVFGKVHSVAKDAQVTIQKDDALFPVKLEWLCFAGQKYQLTK